MGKRTLVVILGPTGVGKTETSIAIAEKFGTAIINADSRQLYKELKIGAAPPTPEQLKRVPHFFVGTLSLADNYSAARFEEDALNILQHLFQEKSLVIMSGGSMLYLDAVCNGIDDMPSIEDDVRDFLCKKYHTEGLPSLLQELKIFDPSYYNSVDHKNTQRIVHALELYYQTGRPYSSFLSREKKKRPFRILRIGLLRERADLFYRINERVLQMMDKGLLQEAIGLYPYRDKNSLNTVGYKELFKYIDGDWTLEQAVEKIQRNTRIYAKKQLTWYKKDPHIHWFHPNDLEKVLAFISKEVLDPS